MYHSHFNCASYNRIIGDMRRARQPFTESHALQFGVTYHDGKGLTTQDATRLINAWNREESELPKNRYTTNTYYLDD